MLTAVLEHFAARLIVRLSRGVLVPRSRLIVLTVPILLWMQLPVLFILQCEVMLRVLVEVEVKCLTSTCKILVRLWNVWTVLLDLLYLLQMLLEDFGSMWCIIPLRCFFDNRLNRRILDHGLNVDRVVHAAENATLVGVWHVNIL